MPEELLLTLQEERIFQFLEVFSDGHPIIIIIDEIDKAFFKFAVPSAILRDRSDCRDSTDSAVAITIDGTRQFPDWNSRLQTSALCLYSEVVACFVAQGDLSRRVSSDGRRYVLFSTPRSGSTFLCDLISSVGVLGRPTEHLKPWLRRYLQRADLPLGQFFRDLHSFSGSENGVFGTKVIIDDFFDFASAYGDTLLNELAATSYFLLVRGNKGEQALSNVRSEKVGVYHIYSTSQDDPNIQALTSLKINVQEVFEKERWLLRQEADLLDYLQSKQVRPALISYEGSVQSRQGAQATLHQLAEALRLNLTNGFTWPGLVKIGKILSSENIALYEKFRRQVTLYSTRSEPWLGEILGEGWSRPENWGVRTISQLATLLLPNPSSIHTVELVINLDELTPEFLLIGGTRVELRRSLDQRQYRWMARVDAVVNDDGFIHLELPNGQLSIEEVVLYYTEIREVNGSGSLGE